MKTKIISKSILRLFLAGGALVLILPLQAAELPRLPKEINPRELGYKEQAKLPDLPEAYASTSPQNLGDGLQVGTLNRPGTQEAVAALIADDKAGKYSNLDSILLWKDGELVFEYYNRHGYVDAPHYLMSITKTLTSVTLARAIQLGLLQMDDLDKPVISFMPEIDRSKIQPGVDTITLRDALYMKSGLRWGDANGDKMESTLSAEYQKQKFFQQLFERTTPITPQSKEYKYAGTDPSLIMMILDIKTGGKARDFIKTELAGKFGVTYSWEDQKCGIPKCGAGANFTSRGLVKIGTAILQGGKYEGEQLLSADYVKEIMAADKGKGYFYYFHNESKISPNKKIDFISGIGAGGQYMSIFPDLNLVVVATAHNKKEINLPLDAILEHLIPLFRN
ncbi:MAG: serine hydrolase [Kiritimatiellales bacterium]